MSKKTEMEAYKEGVTKEAQISSEKHEAQEKKFNEERITVKKGMEGIRAVVNQLVDDGETEALRRIYKLEKGANLRSIESSIKEIIVAILYECCKRMEVVRELQTSYLLTLQRYLDVTEPQRNYDFEALNSNDELTILDNKAIFKVLVEFMYLKNNNSSYESDMLFQEVCGSINITDANKKHITNEVVSLGEIAPEAVIAQYGYLTEELLQYNTDIPENSAQEPTNNVNLQEIKDCKGLDDVNKYETTQTRDPKFSFTINPDVTERERKKWILPKNVTVNNRLTKIIDMINSPNSAKRIKGKHALRMYAMEVCNYLNYFHQGFMRTDSGKRKREKYSTSSDLVAMALVMAYRKEFCDMDSFIVDPKAYAPNDAPGIAAWNRTLKQIDNVDPYTIASLIIGKEEQEEYLKKKNLFPSVIEPDLAEKEIKF